MPKKKLDLSLDYIMQLPAIPRHGDAAIGIGEHGTLVALASLKGNTAIYSPTDVQFGVVKGLKGAAIYAEPRSTLITTGETVRNISEVVTELLDKQARLANAAPGWSKMVKGWAYAVLLTGGLALGSFSKNAPELLDTLGQMAGYGLAGAIFYKAIFIERRTDITEEQFSRQVNELRRRVYELSGEVLKIGEHQGIVPQGYSSIRAQGAPLTVKATPPAIRPAHDPHLG